MYKSFCLFLALVIFAFALTSEAAPSNEESSAKQLVGGNNNFAIESITRMKSKDNVLNINDNT